MERIALQSPPEPAASVARFQWLRTGQEMLAAMLAAIEAARESLRLETYTFVDSPVGRRFRDALVAARGRRVRVSVLMDALGSLPLSEEFWKPLVEAGGEFRWFNPLALGRVGYRDHRKVLVCDEALAFVGGCNLAPEYDGDGVSAGWRDLGLRVEGALARELAGAFDESMARADFKHRRLARLRRPLANERVDGANWSLLLGGPGRGRSVLKEALRADLRRARRVCIVSGYFLPSWRIRKELRRVARRGGSVRLILAAKSDVQLSLLASRRLYQGLMRSGVEIYEYQPQVLHAKLFIVDDAVYAGSANLDARSLNINYELLVRVSDSRVTAEAREIFANDLKHCARIDPAQWRWARGFWTKLLERGAYFVLARLDPWLARWRLRKMDQREK